MTMTMTMTTTTVPASTHRPRPAAPVAGTPPSQSAGPAGPAGRRPGAPGPRGVPARPGNDRRARPAHTDWFGPHRSRSRAEFLDPHALARGFAHLYLEVECGRRPARQLAALMDPALHAQLEPLWVRLHQPLGSIRRVAATVRGGRIHAVVVVQRGSRAGAIAFELSRIARRWYVTAAVRPEDGELAPAPFTGLRPARSGDDLDDGYDDEFDLDDQPGDGTGEPAADGPLLAAIASAS